VLGTLIQLLCASAVTKLDNIGKMYLVRQKLGINLNMSEIERQLKGQMYLVRNV